MVVSTSSSFFFRRLDARRILITGASSGVGLDIVVSNTGAAVFGHVLEDHPDDFDRTLAVTFTGAVNVIRAALPHLRGSRGTIVATGSLMTRVPLPAWSSYSAAKHALRGFLNTLAIEERERGTGVKVAMIHPGPIDTPLFAQASSATAKARVPPDAHRAEVVAERAAPTQGLKDADPTRARAASGCTHDPVKPPRSPAHRPAAH